MINTGLKGLKWKLLEKRGGRGLRGAAKEIGISHSTLTCLEKGRTPSIETFVKVCKWLMIDPGEVLNAQTP